MAFDSSLFTSPIRFARDAKIIGGIDALPGEFPHQVAITYNDDFICGGSIISPFLILTAAHCVFSSDLSHMFLFNVVAGVNNITTVGGSEQFRSVKLIYAHENYTKSNWLNDIAVLLLSEPLRYTDTIRNLNLPRRGESFQGNATISGWGKTKYGGWGSVKLRKVTMPIVSRGICREIYKKSYNITDSMLCIGGTGADSCEGDSGGAAICLRNDSTIVQCGIVSYGLGCGRKEVPGVYTLVSSYIDWIVAAEKHIILMECMVNHLPIGSLSEVSKNTRLYNIKTTYHEFAMKSSMVLANLSSDFEASPKLLDVNFLKNKIRALEKASKNLYMEIVDHKKKAVNLCVANSMRLNSVNVTVDLGWLDEEAHLSEFIKVTYKKFGKTNIQLMLQFIDELPTFWHEQHAEKALLDAMREEADIKSLTTLRFPDILHSCKSDSDSLMTGVCVLALNKCGELIRNGLFQELYNFAVAYPAHFRKILDRIIKTSYETNVKNFENVFQFLINLPLYSDEVFALHVLFNEMKKFIGFNGPEIVTVAFRAKLARDVAERMEELTPDILSKLDDIKSALPETLQSLAFESWVWLKNQDKNVYLVTIGSDSRIFSCQTHTDLSWKIEVIQDGRYIMITRKYSHHAVAYVDKAVRSVGYNDLDHIKSDNRFHWQAISVQGHHKYGNIYFKNRNSSKILVEGESVNLYCNSIKTVDAYSNQERALWIVI